MAYEAKEVEDGIEYLVTYLDDLIIWTYNGKLHRMKGPAVIGLNLPGSEIPQHWWYHGTRVECSTQKEFERYLRLKAFW